MTELFWNLFGLGLATFLFLSGLGILLYLIGKGDYANEQGEEQ